MVTAEKPTETEAGREAWSSLDLARRVADLASEKKAAGTVIIQVREALQVTDYFVVTQGKNRRHLNVIAEHVSKELKQTGLYRIGGTPMNDENWVLLDFGPVVLQVFSAAARTYYDLENLWGDCPRVPWSDPDPPPTEE